MLPLPLAGAAGRGGGGRAARDCHGHRPQTIFYFLYIGNTVYRSLARAPRVIYYGTMTFYSLPFTPERPEATEARLEAIYEAARYGLKGDSLALAAGLTPSQYRRLAEFDALVEIAETKGRADGELSAAKTMYYAAANGDAKAALEILKHQHGWKAAHSVEITVEGQISVIAALEKAERRVIEGVYTEVESAPTPSTFLTNQQGDVVDGYGFDNARAPQKSTDV
jgi:hypothetical protein